MGAGTVTDSCNGHLSFFLWGLPEECIKCDELLACIKVLARKCITCSVIDRCTVHTEARQHCKGPHMAGGRIC